MTDTPEQVTIDRTELDTLLAVARLYLDAFTDEDRLSFTEAWAYQDVQEIVDRHTERSVSGDQPDPRSANS